MLTVHRGYLVDDARGNDAIPAKWDEAETLLNQRKIDSPDGIQILYDTFIRRMHLKHNSFHTMSDYMSNEAMLIKTVMLAIRTSCLTRILWEVEWHDEGKEKWHVAATMLNEDYAYAFFSSDMRGYHHSPKRMIFSTETDAFEVIFNLMEV